MNFLDIVGGSVAFLVLVDFVVFSAFFSHNIPSLTELQLSFTRLAFTINTFHFKIIVIRCSYYIVTKNQKIHLIRMTDLSIMILLSLSALHSKLIYEFI